MELDIETTIGKIRTAIDDIKGTLDDDFAADVDVELKQALSHSVESLLMELPPSLLIPSVLTGRGESADETETSGSEGGESPVDSEVTGAWRVSSGDTGGEVVLPEKFLRFLDMKETSWKAVVYELIEAGSEEEKMQRSPWSRGSSTKPKAMLDVNESGERIVRFWPAKSGSTLEFLHYVPSASEAEGKIICALRDETEKNVIYRAASIFLEGKKEHDMADNFKQLSMM